MIIFYGDIEFYNHIIHHFLCVENIKNDLNSIVEITIPDFFKLEHYQLCKKAFLELYEWTNDAFMHYMGAEHEFILYYFLVYIADIINEEPHFKDIYFDDTCKKMIEQKALSEIDEWDDIEDLKEWYYNVYQYTEDIYRDLDFLMINDLYNLHKSGNDFVAYNLGINLDSYFSILPKDIQKQYPTGHILLENDIFEMTGYLIDRIEHGDILKLLWDGEQSVDVQKIQLYVDSIICAYFETQEIELLWQSNINEKEIRFEF